MIDSDAVAGRAVRVLEHHSIMLHQETVNFTMHRVRREDPVSNVLADLHVERRLTAVVDDVKVPQASTVGTSLASLGLAERHLARQEVAGLGAVVAVVNVWDRHSTTFLP